MGGARKSLASDLAARYRVTKGASFRLKHIDPAPWRVEVHVPSIAHLNMKPVNSGRGQVFYLGAQGTVVSPK